MTILVAIALSLLVTLPLAWKWQLGVRRVAAVVVLIGLAAGALAAATGFLAFAGQVLAAWAVTILAAAGLLLYRFYRDPERIPPSSPDVVVSPADGVIVYVRKSREGALPVVTKKGASYPLVELTKVPLALGEAFVVGISMSFLDVHVNRAPIDGTVSVLQHFPGRFGSLRKPEMVFENERATTVIERPGLQVAVVQIASRLVRQIAVFLKAGQEVRLGQRLGVIRLGSQVDVVLPCAPEVRVSVSPGDRVRAGESIIAVVGQDRAKEPPAAERPGHPHPRGAVIIGGDYRGLCVARSLGRHGVPVAMLHGAGDVLGLSSRYRGQVFEWPRGEEARQVARLLQLAEENGLAGWALFATSDEDAAFLARHAGILSTKYVLTTPSWESMHWAYDKRLTYELASQAQVDFPATFCPFNAAEVEGWNPTFPVIVKPAVKSDDNALTRAKAWRVDDRQMLLALYEKACRLMRPEYIMLQELVPGGGEAQFSYAALCRNGEAIASLTARRTRQYPPDFGHSSSFVETVDEPDVEKAAERLLEIICYTGLVEVEFKRDSRDGKYKLLDINPRVWTWHSLGARAGVDFPLLQWQLLCGQPVPRLRGRRGVKWVRMSTDLPSALGGMARGELSLKEYLRTFRGPLQLALFAADDPVPALFELPSVLFSRGAGPR